jgi:hypothetical protein
MHALDIIDHFRRGSGVNVQIQAINLAKYIVEIMAKDGEVIRYAPGNLYMRQKRLVTNLHLRELT